ncbi:MAG: hypothetical protein MR368_03685 [Azospirillum sp.]|nr:hypothetical protein [Azospirillum sp.]
MSKLKTFLLSAFLSASSFHGQTATVSESNNSNENASPKTEIVSKPKKDNFAQYRQAEKIAIPALIFLEGCSNEAYQDMCKIWTIGIGNTKHPNGSPVKKGDILKDQEEINRYVISHFEKEIYPYLNKYIKRPLAPHEMAAVICLAYNCGVDALGSNNARIAKAINSKNQDEISKAFLTRVATKTKKFSNGLAIRRTLEYLIFKGALTEKDIKQFYIGGYGKLNYKNITKVKKNKNFYGRVAKTDLACLNYIKSICSQSPDPNLISSISWYGGDKKVGEYMETRQEERMVTNIFAQCTKAALTYLQKNKKETAAEKTIAQAANISYTAVSKAQSNIR